MGRLHTVFKWCKYCIYGFFNRSVSSNWPTLLITLHYYTLTITFYIKKLQQNIQYFRNVFKSFNRPMSNLLCMMKRSFLSFIHFIKFFYHFTVKNLVTWFR